MRGMGGSRGGVTVTLTFGVEWGHDLAIVPYCSNINVHSHVDKTMYTMVCDLCDDIHNS